MRTAVIRRIADGVAHTEMIDLETSTVVYRVIGDTVNEVAHSCFQFNGDTDVDKIVNYMRKGSRVDWSGVTLQWCAYGYVTSHNGATYEMNTYGIDENKVAERLACVS